MKTQCGNQCIMLFKWELCDLLLLDTRENANLLRVHVVFSTLINYFRKLFEIFRELLLAETTTGRCYLKKADARF